MFDFDDYASDWSASEGSVFPGAGAWGDYDLDDAIEQIRRHEVLLEEAREYVADAHDDAEFDRLLDEALLLASRPVLVSA